MSDTMSLIDAVQWPAMVITVAASWFVAATHKQKRNVGFWLFLVSNAAWVVWGLHSGAHALVVLQICLAAMNIRGAFKASADSSDAATGKAEDSPKSPNRRQASRSDQRPTESA